MKRVVVVLFVVLALSLSACTSAPGRYATEASDSAPRGDANALYSMTSSSGADSYAAASVPESVSGVAPAEAQSRMAFEAWGRKVIKTAWLKLEVVERASVADQLAAHAASVGGFVLSSSQGETWTRLTLRVPSSTFEETLTRAGGLGKVTDRRIDGQDVTEEYLDLEARIANAERVRDRLTGLLERATRIEEMLNIEREVARLQGQIEQMKGRLAFLAHRVDLSTIDVDLRDAEKPGFPGPVTLAFRGAWWLVTQLFWIQKPEFLDKPGRAGSSLRARRAREGAPVGAPDRLETPGGVEATRYG